MLRRTLALLALMVSGCDSGGDAPTSPRLEVAVAGSWSGDATVVGTQGGGCAIKDFAYPVGAARSAGLVAAQADRSVALEFRSHLLLRDLKFNAELRDGHLSGRLLVQPFDLGCSPPGSFIDTRPLDGSIEADVAGDRLQGTVTVRFQEHFSGDESDLIGEPFVYVIDVDLLREAAPAT